MSDGFGPSPQPDLPFDCDQPKHEHNLVGSDEHGSIAPSDLPAGSDEHESIALSDLPAGSDGLGPDPQFDLTYFWDRYDEASSSSSSKLAQETSSSEHSDQKPRPVKTMKRLFICCDGTWQNAIGTNRPLTNVARFARSVKRKGHDDAVQIVYYASGVGSKPDNTTKAPKSVFQWMSDIPAVGQWFGNKFTRYHGGTTGAGIIANILNAYYFLCHNYNFKESKDEIILVGFSRGAFTVRCLASFISDVGLLRRKALPFLQTLFELWKEKDASIKEKIMLFKEKDMLRDVSIKVCAEWDAVSALWSQELSFVQDTVPEKVDHAFHAIALHEERSDFQPVLWRSRPGSTNVKQCLFVGSHSDVGGGNADPTLATLSLLWMISQVMSVCKARFDTSILLNFFGPSVTQERKWGILGPYMAQRFRNGEMESHSLRKGHVEDSYKSLWLWKLRGKRQRKELLFPDPSPTPSDEDPGLNLLTHFTVRLLIEKRGQTCEILEDYQFDHLNHVKGWKKRGELSGRAADFIREDLTSTGELEWLGHWFMRAECLANGNPLEGDKDYFEILTKLMTKISPPVMNDNSLIVFLRHHYPQIPLRVLPRASLQRSEADRARGRSQTRSMTDAESYGATYRNRSLSIPYQNPLQGMNTIHARETALLF